MKKTLKTRIVTFVACAAIISFGVAVFSSVDKTAAVGTNTLYDSGLQTVFVEKEGKFVSVGSLMNVKEGDKFKIFSDVSGTWVEESKVFTAAANADFASEKKRWAVKTQ